MPGRVRVGDGSRLGKCQCWRVGMRVWEEERQLWDSFCRAEERGRTGAGGRGPASHLATPSAGGNGDEAVQFFPGA